MATAPPPANSGAAPSAAAKKAPTPAQRRVRTKSIEGLKAARMRPARPTYFMLCVGNRKCVPYLAPIVGTSHRTLLRPLMAGDTGLKYHRGQCVYERGYWTFVGPTVSPGLRQKLERGLTDLTGQKYRVKLRRGEIEPPRQSSGAELPV
jgi:hypothetical protein